MPHERTYLKNGSGSPIVIHPGKKIPVTLSFKPQEHGDDIVNVVPQDGEETDG